MKMDAKSQTLMERQLERLDVLCKDIRDSQSRIGEAVERLMARPPEQPLSPASTGNPMPPPEPAVGPGAISALGAKIDLLVSIEKENRDILAHLQRII